MFLCLNTMVPCYHLVVGLLVVISSGVVIGSDNVILTVTNSESNETVQAITNDLLHLDFESNQKVSVECKKETNDGPVLLSGLMIIKICFNDISAHLHSRNNEVYCLISKPSSLYSIPTTLKLTYESHKAVLHCIYKSNFTKTYEARVELRWKAAFPKISQGGVANGNPKLRNIVFEGKIGETKKFECTNQDTVGWIHWEFCKNEHDTNCVPREYNYHKLHQDITISKENSGTIVKCVYTSPNKMTKETKIVLYANNISWKFWNFFVVLVCAVIIGVAVYVLRKALRRKSEDHGYVNASVIYNTNYQQQSTPPIYTAPTLRPANPVSRDSAKYVTMTPGETPSVARYLLPTMLKKIMKSPQQDNHESGWYTTMKARNHLTIPLAPEFEKPIYSLPVRPERYSTARSSSMSSEQEVYDECIEGYPNNSSPQDELTYETI